MKLLMIGAVRQTGSSGRPSIVTGCVVRTAMAVVAELSAAGDPTAAFWSRQDNAKACASAGMGLLVLRPRDRTGFAAAELGASRNEPTSHLGPAESRLMSTPRGQG